MAEPTEPTGLVVFEEVAPIVVETIDAFDNERTARAEEFRVTLMAAEQRVATMRDRVTRAEAGLAEMTRENREDMSDLNLRRNEAAVRSLRAAAPELADRSTDECYQIFAAWAYANNQPEARQVVFDGLVNLREAIGDASLDQPKFVVMHIFRGLLERVIVVTAPPVIGVRDQDENNKLVITLASDVVVNAQDGLELVDLTDVDRMERGRRLYPEDLEKAKVVDSLEGISELELARLETDLSVGTPSLENTRDFLQARAALGLPNDDELTQRVIDKYLGNASSGRALLALSQMIMRPEQD